MTPTCSRSGSGTLGLELRAVLAKVFPPINQFQVFEPVVQLVSAHVMNNHSARNRSVRFLPNQPRTQLPHIRLGHLHERSCVAVPLVANPNSYSTNRLNVDWPDTRPERARLIAATALVFHVTARHRTVGGDAPTRLEGTLAVSTDVVSHALILAAFAGTHTDQRRAECARNLFGTKAEIPGQIDMFGGAA